MPLKIYIITPHDKQVHDIIDDTIEDFRLAGNAIQVYVSHGYNGVKTFRIVLDDDYPEASDFLESISSEDTATVESRDVTPEERPSIVLGHTEVAATLQETKRVENQNTHDEDTTQILKPRLRNAQIHSLNNRAINSRNNHELQMYYNNNNKRIDLLYQYLANNGIDPTLNNLDAANQLTDDQLNPPKRTPQ